MNIQPYSILMTHDNTFIFVESISKRKLSDAVPTNDIIVSGIIFKNKVGLDGENDKNFLNVRTANYKQIKKFIYNNAKACEDSWIYLAEVKAVVTRDPITFTIESELEFV